MNATRTEFLPVLRTGQLIHFDWACAALDQAGIAYQCREETSGGIRVAMPVAPAPGPGTWWTILVPESMASRARETLTSLPFEQTMAPDVWDFRPKRAGKLAWQLYAAAALAFFAILAAGAVLEVVNQIR